MLPAIINGCPVGQTTPGIGVSITFPPNGVKMLIAFVDGAMDTKRNTAKKNEARKVKNLLFIHLIIHYSAYFFDSFYI